MPTFSVRVRKEQKNAVVEYYEMKQNLIKLYQSHRLQHWKYGKDLIKFPPKRIKTKQLIFTGNVILWASFKLDSRNFLIY